MGEEVALMKGRRHTPEQVVRKLREADRLLAEGTRVNCLGHLAALQGILELRPGLARLPA
jgi:hypothetical protein